MYIPYNVLVLVDNQLHMMCISICTHNIRATDIILLMLEVYHFVKTKDYKKQGFFATSRFVVKNDNVVAKNKILLLKNHC